LSSKLFDFQQLKRASMCDAQADSAAAAREVVFSLAASPQPRFRATETETEAATETETETETEAEPTARRLPRRQLQR
jgi:hypothetical protein